MKNQAETGYQSGDKQNLMPDSFCNAIEDAAETSWKLAGMPFDIWGAIALYHGDFIIPLAKAAAYFHRVEYEKNLKADPFGAFADYSALLEMNLDIACRAVQTSAQKTTDYWLPELRKNSDPFAEPEEILSTLNKQAETFRAAARDFPEAIAGIADEYGFHFERGDSEKVAETDRFLLYRILPGKNGKKTRKNGKPVLIVHPYVLGSDILAFLPGENKSYVHCFANQGIPTYVRILKDIDTNTAVQNITLEQDILDTRHFCEVITKTHGRRVTLNGYCQGGLITLSAILSGQLDGLVDAHITCVAPIDGTRSPGLGQFLKDLPRRFNDLAYGTKPLANGNRVADGDLMSWVYKLKSISEEYPVAALCRDLAMLRNSAEKKAGISKTAAALNYWVFHQRHDLPMEITKLSFASYNTPITKEGNLPFTAFENKLNIKRQAEKGIRMLICYGENDDLVEKPCALAPLDYIDAETTAFPKGHVAIATTWSNPSSDYALHNSFEESGSRGPVRFQLDLEEEEDKAR